MNWLVQVPKGVVQKQGKCSVVQKRVNSSKCKTAYQYKVPCTAAAALQH